MRESAFICAHIEKPNLHSVVRVHVASFETDRKKNNFILNVFDAILEPISHGRVSDENEKGVKEIIFLEKNLIFSMGFDGIFE